MRMQTEILIDKYRDRLFAAAFSVCKNAEDADDVVQETFIKYHTQTRQFESEEHIKYWLIRVTINESKKALRSPWRKTEPIEDYASTIAFSAPEQGEVFAALMELPEKYRTALYLYYVEEYSSSEIARILKMPQSTVLSHLSRGRELLKRKLKEAEANV